jgi:hypothetical protein
VTLVWLLIWFIADLIGDNEPLLTDPVNIWTGTLILAIGLDLGGPPGSTRRPAQAPIGARHERSYTRTRLTKPRRRSSAGRALHS